MRNTNMHEELGSGSAQTIDLVWSYRAIQSATQKLKAKQKNIRQWS